MPEALPDHRAEYDADGGILLPGAPRESRRQHHAEVEAGFHRGWSDLRSNLEETATAFAEEGKRQYLSSAADIERGVGSIGTVLHETVNKLLATLAQPVWLVKPNRAPKQYKRGTLFLLDTLRFGGTFATIFVALFVSLNYESFWQIARDEAVPLRAAQQALTEQADAAVRASLLRSPQLAVAGDASAGDILSYLPPVGPPQNRLVIPKLNLNVPLVNPPIDALLDEDWERVETDIQTALQDGVVHYPGTAKPGQAGNFFVTGHSSYYPWAEGAYKTVFARLHRLEVGDEYEVYFGGDRHRYIIREKSEVKPTNVDVLRQPLDPRLSTLMTCTPVGTTLRRLILLAQEVDPVTGEPLAVGEQAERPAIEVQPQLLPI